MNAQIANIRNEENIRISLFDSLFFVISSVADDLTKLVLVVLM